MKIPPLLADFTHARPCKPFCENSLTLPRWGGGGPYLREKSVVDRRSPLSKWKAGTLFAIGARLSRKIIDITHEEGGGLCTAGSAAGIED